MDVGAIGLDGRSGGRLEREVAMYEEAVNKKRKGYRDKVKARESNGADGEREGEDRGEPSSKKVRRMSEGEQDEEEEQRMLEQQLNGTAGAKVVNGTGTEQHRRWRCLRRPSTWACSRSGSHDPHTRSKGGGRRKSRTRTIWTRMLSAMTWKKTLKKTTQTKLRTKMTRKMQTRLEMTMKKHAMMILTDTANTVTRQGLLPNGEVEIDSGDESEGSY